MSGVCFLRFLKVIFALSHNLILSSQYRLARWLPSRFCAVIPQVTNKSGTTDLLSLIFAASWWSVPPGNDKVPSCLRPPVYLWVLKLRLPRNHSAHTMRATGDPHNNTLLPYVMRSLVDCDQQKVVNAFPEVCFWLPQWVLYGYCGK